MLPLVPASPVVEEAEALEGTTNYGDFFTIGHRDGQPGSISGNRLISARTDYSWAYGYRAKRWASSSTFVSKRTVSLASDWEIKFKVSMTEPRQALASASTSHIRCNFQGGLSSTSDAANLNGIAGVFVRDWARGIGRSSDMHMSTMTNSLVTGNLVPADTSFPSLDSYDVILRYQRATGALSISAGGKTQSTTVSGKLS